MIRTNRASLILSAEDFIQAMGWNTSSHPTKGVVQCELFPELNEEEMKIVRLLQQHPEGIQINLLVVEANIPIHQMSALLFELEMKGVVRALAGGVYRLI